MSSPSEGAHEPDMTPLLDLVLQLVMFFMLVVHFESEQRNEKVQLPKAGIAKGLVKNDKERILFINVLPQRNEQTNEVSRTQAIITVFEGTAMKEYTNQVQLRDYLATEIQKDEKSAGSGVWATGKGRSVVVLRADKDCTFRHVYDTMTTIKTVGYSEVQLRAQVDKTSGG
jgi:biopolymer transport protein ExbD